ncbi:hypothetical protein [Sandaracinus amylolyticus]|uniref:Peptidase M1 membrane alanine aminopeptidase domain-containing protein n=1 Tax=Sandaracinus amylolyticus TaxID=927083 RepID=A0A0F6SH58_9BACT|nr:hypothetical protein [Sandaracinus amylolyticus]AKF09869.1 hypothetical protein DB32_007018 [Sandaracinus amylolyticus]
MRAHRLERSIRRSNRRRGAAPLATLALLLLAGCGDEPSTAVDAGAPDSGTPDAGSQSVDAGTDGGPPACAELFDLEPPGTTPSSAWADVASLDAVFTFDVAAQRTTADVTWTIRTGPSADPIVFDLLQQPAELEVDGATIAGDAIGTATLPGSTPSTIRLLPVSPCSTHVVTARYELAPTPAGATDAPRRVPRFDAEADTVIWAPRMSDQRPGMYLESWLPASLVHDAFESTIRFVVVGGAPHRLFANGEIETSAENDWTVRYPATFRSSSHFWYLAPSEGMRVVERSVGDVAITVVAMPDHTEAIEPLADEVVASIPDFERFLGPYPHPAFLAVITPESYGMEHAGATLTVPRLLRHELMHSWIGRGAYPRRARHNWIDEALVTYYENYVEPRPLGDRPPTRLEGTGWVRGWADDDHYFLGADLFRAWANELGAAPLHQLLREFFVARHGRDYTTEELRTALYCASRSTEILRTFDRHVFGLESPGPAPDCEP